MSHKLYITFIKDFWKKSKSNTFIDQWEIIDQTDLSKVFYILLNLVY